MRLHVRLQRLERCLSRPTPEAPPLAAILESGEWIALVGSEWVPWSADRPLPRYCKLYRGFDPRVL